MFVNDVAGAFLFVWQALRWLVNDMHSPILALIVAVAAASQKPLGSTNLHPVILADTNRDGVVDERDKIHRHVWTADHGAIFLPNIGDETHRCAVTDKNGAPLSNMELAACNDAAGDILLNSTLAAKLTTLPITVSENATARVFTEPPITLQRTRLFWKRTSSEWATVQPQLQFNATALKAGIQLAIDGRELVTDSTWDGRVNVVFQVTDANDTVTDVVAMRQAPVLLHHHLQAPDTVVTFQTAPGVSAYQHRFVSTFQSTLRDAFPTLPLLVLNDSNEVWAQDFMEPAYASMPGDNGPVSIRVLLRSAQSTRANGRRVFEHLRRKGVGGWQPGLGSGFGWEEINSGGNIETIPPYTSRSGKTFRNGRVLLGKHFDKMPAESMVQFLQAQEEQDPLFLETGWLLAGHIDEIVQFLPHDNPLGFIMAVPDTRSALEILNKTLAQRSGDVPVLSYDGDMTPDNGTYFVNPLLRNTTIKGLFDEAFLATNEYAQKYINQNVNLLLRELPINKNDVLRVPALFQDMTYKWPVAPDGIPGRLHDAIPGEKQLQAQFPHALNGLVLGRTYIAPKPWGPRVSGMDVYEEAIRAVYRGAGMDVRFVDDYMSHHVRGGEVHCGTNTLREMPKWWR